MKALLILLITLISAYAECPLPNMSVGDLRISSEKELKKVIRRNEIFVLVVSATW
jgi:hypothetical protein